MQACSRAATVGQIQWASLAPELSAPAARIESEDRIALIWPGFWADDVSYVLTRRNVDALAVTASAPPTDFTRIAGSEGTGRRHYYYHAGPLGDQAADRGFSLKYHIGGRASVALGVGPSVSSTVNTMIHESFHVFQEERFTDPSMPGTGVGDGALGNLDVFAAQVDSERQLLILALRQASPQERDMAAAQYIRRRSERLSHVSATLANAENQTERIEGSAQYVESAAASMSPHPDVNALRDSLISQLSIPLASFPQMFGQAGALMRWRLYATGAAQMLLLNEMHVPWQARVEKGMPPSQLLAEHVLKANCTLANPPCRSPSL
ncbi:MAG: hypothetical protein ABJE47_07480 [bacterium]